MAKEQKKSRLTKIDAKPRQENKFRPKASNDVVYTPPAPLNRRKLILRLLVVVAVVAALFLSFSIFFKVDRIVVSGHEKYSYEAVVEAADIDKGGSLLAFGKAKAAGRITRALPYVKSVRIGISLPGTVKIHIEELDVVYSVQDTQNNWWLITCDGRVVEKTDGANAVKNTVIRGVQLKNPIAGAQAIAAESEEDATNAEGETVQQDVSNSRRLKAVLDIAYQLELNEILGAAVSIDVTDMTDIEMWYGTQYQVLLGDEGQMEEKIATMKATINQMDSRESGVMDLTFTSVPDGVKYTPFT